MNGAQIGPQMLGRRWQLSWRRLSSLAGMLVLLLAAGIGSGFMLPMPARAQEGGPAMPRLPDDQQSGFDDLLRALRDEFATQSRERDQLNADRDRLTAGWSQDNVREAESWFRTSSYFSPAGAEGPGDARLKREAANLRFKSAQQAYVDVLGDREKRDPAGREAWTAYIALERANLEVVKADVWALKFQNTGLQAYRRTWLYKDWDSFVEDGWEHLKYIYQSHAETFWDDLSDCAVKALFAGLKDELLVFRRVEFLGLSDARTLVSTPGVMPAAPLPGLPQYTVTTRGGKALACLPDTARKSLVRAMVANYRKAFVDELADQGVETAVAEYWWHTYMLATGSEGGPLEARVRSADAVVADRLARTLDRNVGLRFLLNQAKEELKTDLRYRSSQAVAQAFKETTAELHNLHKQAYREAMRSGEMAAASKMHQESMELRKKAGEAAFENHALDKYLKAIDWAGTVLEEGTQYVSLLRKERAFDAQLGVLLERYREVKRCLALRGMATGPQQTIAVLKLRDEGWRDFLQLCRQPSDQQVQAALDEAGKLIDRLWALVGRAEAVAASARGSCEAAIAAAASATRQADARPVDPRRARAADLQARIAGIDQLAADAAAAELNVGLARNAVEASALVACEAARGVGGLPTAAERQARVDRAATAAADAAVHRATAAAQRQKSTQAATDARAASDRVVPAADTLAADLAAAQAPAAGVAELEAAQRHVRASRGLTISITPIHVDAMTLAAEVERLLSPLPNAATRADETGPRRGQPSTAASLRVQARDFVARIAALAGGDVDGCQSRAEQAIGAAQAAIARAEARTAPPAFDAGALKQAAQAAAQRATSMGELAADYERSAETALKQAQLCRDMATDLARSADRAAAAATGQAGSGTGSTEPERDPAAAAADCNARFAGSVPAWDNVRNRPACVCPGGAAPNATGNACIDCAGTEANFAAAFNAGDLAAAQGWLAEGGRCAWAPRANAALAGARQQLDLSRQRHELDCLTLETNILAALNARNLGAAQGLLGQAQAMNCVLGAQTQSAVRESIARQQQAARDQQQLAALSQFTQNWQRLLQGTRPPPVQPQPTPQRPVQPTPPAPLQPLPGAATPPAAAAAAQPWTNYEPKGNGYSCAAMSAQLEAQCARMNKDTEIRKCQLERGRSGCALEYPGCGVGLIYDLFDEKACTLHPSYPPKAQPLVQRYLQEVQGCVERFFGDRQAGAFQRGYDCTQAAAQRARQPAGSAFVQACEARCTQDGGRRNPNVTNFCNCSRPGGRPR